jgi:hypothetical protein
MARICPPEELPSNVIVLEETKQIKARSLLFRLYRFVNLAANQIVKLNTGDFGTSGCIL